MKTSTQKLLLVPAIIVIVALVVTYSLYLYQQSHAANVVYVAQNGIVTPALVSDSQALISASSTPMNGSVATSTAGWKTYADAQYSYEVKYPVDGTFQNGNGSSEIGGDWVVINLWTSNDGALHPDRKTMYIQVDGAVSMHPCGDPFKNSDGTITKNLTNVNLDGVMFTKGDISPDRNLDLAFADEYCAVRNGNRYQIIVGQYLFGGTGAMTSSSSLLESDILINQAISTFKFTN